MFFPSINHYVSLDHILWATVAFLVSCHIYRRFRTSCKRKEWARIRQESDLSNTDNQLRFVSEASFVKKAIMSKEVYHVFTIVEQFMREKSQGHRVLPEVPLGAILWCNDYSGDHRAFKSINSKRLDIGVIDKFGKPCLAIEYQGGGHWRGNAEGRDAVKRLALEKAGIPLVELFPQENAEAIRAKIAAIIH